MNKRRRIVGSFFIFILAASVWAARSPLKSNGASGSTKSAVSLSTWTGHLNEDWSAIEKLILDQKYEEASRLIQKKCDQAKAEKNSEEWSHSLIRLTQLRVALHGYETAVEFLKNQPWPSDLLAQSSLNLFYAHSLTTYAHVYSWEIRQREKMGSPPHGVF